MGVKKGNNKKKALFSHRTRRSKTVPEAVCDAVRDYIITGSKSKVIKQQSTVKKISEEWSKYTILNEDCYNVEPRYIKSMDGIGLFAKRRIGKDLNIPELWSSFGTKIREQEGIDHRSAIQSKDGDKCAIWRPMYGPISFLNHACIKHSNCVTVYGGANEQFDYKKVQTKKVVQKNDELTITYDTLTHNIPCAMCNMK